MEQRLIDKKPVLQRVVFQHFDIDIKIAVSGEAVHKLSETVRNCQELSGTLTFLEFLVVSDSFWSNCQKRSETIRNMRGPDSF